MSASGRQDVVFSHFDGRGEVEIRVGLWFPPLRLTLFWRVFEAVLKGFASDVVVFGQHNFRIRFLIRFLIIFHGFC